LVLVALAAHQLVTPAQTAAPAFLIRYRRLAAALAVLGLQLAVLEDQAAAAFRPVLVHQTKVSMADLVAFLLQITVTAAAVAPQRKAAPDRPLPVDQAALA
jgi:hypothetical protein